MKLIFSALAAIFLAAPLAHADCEKCKKGTEEKKEGTMLVDCEKCKKGTEEKKEGTLADCEKCKKGTEEKKEGTLA